MKIIVLSDTHGLHERITIPPGDMLIHCGDFCPRGNFRDIQRFNEFLGNLPHCHKIVIAGNHDVALEEEAKEAQALLTNCIYLQDQSVAIEGIKFYGSPWQPEFMNWAFNLRRGEALRAKWDLIPADVDVLITHGPPWGIGDRTSSGEHVGCEELLKRVQQIRPRYHLFGHIHEGYGMVEQWGIQFMNASICNASYHPVNNPIVFFVPALPLV